MKKILLIIFLLCVVKFQAQEIKGFSFDATGGITAPLGDYKTYTKTLGQTNGNNLIGFTEKITGETQFSFDASYQFGAVGLGASLGIFSHEISSLTYEIDFPTQISGGKIDGIYYGLGPRYVTSFGDFKFAGVFQIGMMNLSLSKFIGSYNGSDVNQPIEILNTEIAPGSNSTLPYTSFGIKFYYPITGQLSAFIKAEYLTSIGNGLKIKDTYVPPVDVNNDGSITSADTELFVNSDNLVEEMRFLKPQFFFFGVGLGYSFGDTAKMPLGPETPKEKKGRLNPPKIANDDDSDGDGLGDIEESIEIEKENNDVYCFRAELLLPVNYYDVFLNTENRPDYKWQTKPSTSGSKPDYYVIKFYDQNNKILHEERVKQSGIKHSSALEKVYQSYFNEEDKSISWEVESHFKECEVKVSDKRIISGNKNNVGLIADFRNITCNNPAYDGDGNVCYKAEVYLENPANNTSSLTVPVNPIFTVTNTSGGNPSSITNPLMCAPSAWTGLPIVLAPGDTALVCFEFCRPIGETQTALHINYHQTQFPNLTMEEIPTEILPNCVCNMCDDLEIVSTNGSLWPSAAGYANMRIRNDFRIFNSDPIQQVKAEVVYVQHLINDAQCYTCTKSDDQMGMFKEGPRSGRILGMQSEWLDNGQATLYDENNDGFGNEFTWNAKYFTGVDFTNNKIFIMNLSLPHSSSLDCCKTTYKVCVRYTFTNINCESCDYLVCYEFDSEDVQSGGTGNGNQLPNYEDIKLTPKRN